MSEKVFYRWKRKKIEFDGFCLSYLEGGMKSSRNPIFFLHGWSVSTEPYFDCLNCLSQRYWIIAPDLPGFGKSNCFNLLSSYQDYAELLIQLVERLNIKRFELIGHSFGGEIASVIAASFPHRVSNLVIINSTGIPLIPFPVLFKKNLPNFQEKYLNYS